MSFRFTLSSSKGFTLIEILITAFVLGVVTVALTGLSLVITRSSIESEREEVAINVATEKVENLRAAFESRGYEVVEYTDVSPLGVVEREATLTRNNLEYTVRGYLHDVDDPANGTGTVDYRTVLYKVSWTSNVGGVSEAISEDGIRVAASALTLSPDTAQAQGISATVVAAVTLYTEKAKNDSCIPGTKTCPITCPADEPNTCPDENGNFTKTCSPLGICPDFGVCPASGQCSKVGTAPPPSDQPPSDEQCPNGTFDFAAEQCSPAQCNDGRDNDGDNGIDVNGLGNNPPDVQCEEMLGNTANGVDDDGDGAVDEPDEAKIFHVLGPCVATEESCRATGKGQQLMGVQEPEWSGCYRLCRINNFLRSCDADCSKVSDSDCQDKRGGRDKDGNPIGICPPDSSCTLQDDPKIVNPCGGPGPGQKSICAESRSGACVECVASNVSRCRDTVPDFCGFGGGLVPCVCDYNRCAQCNAVNAQDDNCPVEKPYCFAGGGCAGDDESCGRKTCVECIDDQDCRVAGKDPNKPYCVGNVCSANDLQACEDLVDNDGDRKIDFDGGVGAQRDPDCENRFDDTEEGPGDTLLPPAECADGIDNDGDQDIDFGADSGCSWQFDSPEDDPLSPTPDPGIGVF